MQKSNEVSSSERRQDNDNEAQPNQDSANLHARVYVGLPPNARFALQLQLSEMRMSGGQRPGPREAWIATSLSRRSQTKAEARWPGSVQVPSACFRLPFKVDEVGRVGSLDSISSQLES